VVEAVIGTVVSRLITLPTSPSVAQVFLSIPVLTAHIIIGFLLVGLAIYLLTLVRRSRLGEAVVPAVLVLVFLILALLNGFAFTFRPDIVFTLGTLCGFWGALILAVLLVSRFGRTREPQLGHATAATNPRGRVLRSILLALSGILLEVAVTFLLAYGLLATLTIGLGRMPSVAIPAPIQWVGLVVLLSGAALAIATLRYRRPLVMIESTYLTLAKLYGRHPTELAPGREEALSVVGPYRYVRNPLYLAVFLFTAGLGLFDSSLLLLVWAAALLAWFLTFLVPFEEKELLERFGERYARYTSCVPSFFPWRRPHGEETAQI
jgi:protein-S-isoprenylcysteine O-methyltransferase Ste14